MKWFCKNKHMLFILVIVSLMAVTGITVSFMLRGTKAVINEFETAVVTCSVKEEFDGNQKSRIQVENTGNIDAYLRIRMVSYWVDEAGNIVGKSSEMPKVEFDDSFWIKGLDDTYYYKQPAAPKQLTQNLLKAPIVLKTDTFNESTVYQVVEVFAEAIQSKPAKAVEESWEVTLSQDGVKIEAVK